MTNLVLDLLIVAVIALFALMGWRKGLVLTLCGLLVVFVAYFGASYVSNTFSDGLAAIIQPSIQNQLEAAVEQALPSGDAAPPSPLLPDPDGTHTPVQEQVTASLSQVLAVLKRSTFFAGMFESVSQAVTDGAIRVVTTASAAIADYLAHQISRVGLFFLTFFLIVVVWALLSRALDLVCHLPVLRSFNEIGGLLFGLAEGVCILLAAVGLVTLLGLIPEDVASQTFLYRHFMNFQIPVTVFS